MTKLCVGLKNADYQAVIGEEKERKRETRRVISTIVEVVVGSSGAVTLYIKSKTLTHLQPCYLHYHSQ